MRDGRSHDNIDHMHSLVQQLQRGLEHLVQIARQEFEHPDSDYDKRMMDAFAQAIITTGQGLHAVHAMIDQEFEPITEEDVLAAFRQRRGIPDHGPRPLAQQPDTRGTVPLSELPNWDAETFDPGTPAERHERNTPIYKGRHFPPGMDLSVSPEERGDGIT